MAKVYFNSEARLKEAQAVINEADLILKNKKMTIKDSQMKAALNASLAATGYCTFSTVSRTLPSAMVTGAVLPAILPVIGIIGVIAAVTAAKKIAKQKEAVYQEAIKKQNEIIKALSEERAADKERIDALTAMNKTLQSIIVQLESDMKVA